MAFFPRCRPAMAWAEYLLCSLVAKTQALSTVGPVTHFCHLETLPAVRAEMGGHALVSIGAVPAKDDCTTMQREMNSFEKAAEFVAAMADWGWLG